MSVIVLGMEMPECCGACEYFYDLSRCILLNYTFYHEEGEPNVFCERLSDCPLRPLPEKHGRLGDLDELEDIFYQVGHSQSAGYVQDAETIVEAEGD